jgi:hypothetical protein
VQPAALSSKAKAKICMSVSDKKNESPTLFAEAFTLFQKSSEGALTFSFPLSTAVLNRTHGIELFLISSLTLGTVAWSSFTEKGSNPAKKAEVSSTMIRLHGLFLWIFHPVPLNSNRLRNRL